MNELWQNAALDVKGLPKVEEGIFFRHPIRYRRYKYVQTSITYGFLIVAYIVLLLLFPGAWKLWVGIGLGCLVIFSFIAVHKGYARRSYALRERDITYKKGWLFYSTLTIPFNRIQHSEVTKGPLEQQFGLSTLKIYTAGGSSSDLSIPGIDDAEAKRLREYISKNLAVHV